MAKLKFLLKEDELDDAADYLTEPTVAPAEEVLGTDTDTPEEGTIPDSLLTNHDDSPKFIASPELNSLREILLDLKDEISLLLLGGKVIVLGRVDNLKTYVLTLPESAEDFIEIEIPIKLDEILNNPTIIKYTPEGPDERHSQVTDILMKKLNEEKSEDEETEPTELPEEPLTDEEPSEEIIEDKE